MLSFLLATDSNDGGKGMEIVTYVMLGILVVAIIAMFFVSNRRNKKRQEEADKLINAVKPGNKVKTIGGVCGIVVEVDDDEGTFVLETGSEASGKCYMKFDKQAIYQTDAVVEQTLAAPAAEEPATPEEPFTAEQSDAANEANYTDENK